MPGALLDLVLDVLHLRAAAGHEVELLFLVGPRLVCFHLRSPSLSCAGAQLSIETAPDVADIVRHTRSPRVADDGPLKHVSAFGVGDEWSSVKYSLGW